MLTMEDYLKKRKKKDKINEFGQKTKLENLKLTLGYVTDYYLKYLDYNNVKSISKQHNEKVNKYKKQLRVYDKELANWLLQIYDDHEAKLPQTVNYHLKSVENFLLFYYDEEFNRLAQEFYEENLSRMPYLKGHVMNVSRLIKAIYNLRSKRDINYKDLILLGSPATKWIFDTYSNYSVNLDEFASDYINRFSNHFSQSDDYDYKQKQNVFGIDIFYEENKERPFIKGHKKELEMLFMYYWLYSIVGDEDYWNEYINNTGI